MNYAELRPKIVSGDLIALSHYKWASLYDLQVQAVRVFTESEYSHVGMAWVVGGRVFMIESVTPVIRLVPLSNFAEDGFYWMPTAVPMSAPELEFALSKVGVGRYSKLRAILSQIWHINIGAGSSWECAEFVIACRRLSGVNLGEKATPAAVVKAAESLGNALYFIQG